MKKLLTVALSAVIGATALTSCSKKSDSSPSYSMKTTIGKTSFSGTNCYAILAGGALSISGWNGTSTVAVAPYLSLTIMSWNGGTGATSVDSTMTAGAISWMPDASSVTGLYARSGTITISSVSSSAISGSFSGTMSDGSQVTGGTFTAKR